MSVQDESNVTPTAIVVLGAAVWAGQEPSPSLRRRALHAAKLFDQEMATLIIGSGGVGRFPPSEAKVIQRLLKESGVPTGLIILEDKSHTTLENVLYSARILKMKDVSKVLVVSDRYHLPRAMLCFWSLGFKVSGSGPDRGVTGTPLRKWIYYHLREFAALPLYVTKIPKLRRRFADAGD